MLMVACFLVCLATVPLTGGRLGALADFKPGKVWALWVALAIQAVIIFVPGGPSALYPAGHVVSYGFAFLFLWVNRDLSGLWLITLGAAMNTLATVVNGGVMPATRARLSPRPAWRRLEAGSSTRPSSPTPSSSSWEMSSRYRLRFP